MKPFTQKHFGSKGASTDDSHSFTKAGAAVMKKCAVYSYGAPIQQRKEGESEEDYGKRTYNEAMSRIKAQQETSQRMKKQRAQQQTPSLRVKMGMGTSVKSQVFKGPRVKSGMGTSLKTHFNK